MWRFLHITEYMIRRRFIAEVSCGLESYEEIYKGQPGRCLPSPKTDFYRVVHDQYEIRTI